MIRRLTPVLAATLALGAAGEASALTLEASNGALGWIDLRVTGTPGSTVTVTENGEAVADITLRSDSEVRRRATPWRCDRQTRAFIASDGTEEATAEVRTPGCGGRLGLSVRPFAPRVGGALLARVVDRWRVGAVEAEVCFAGRCRTASIRPGRASRTVKLRASKRGIRALTATASWGQRSRRTLEVRPRGRPLTLLATGDSMIQIVDSYLKQRLRGRMRVQSEARISTGISKPFLLDWVAMARRQALARRPNVTVMFIGANDGFPIGGVQCCGRRWIEGYASRARRMIRSYRRRGSAKVYWLTLPAPRKPDFARIYRAVNTALRRASTAFAGAGRIIDTARVFTPGGRFRSTLNGRVVRQADGVHLNTTGASIAANLIIRRLRRDGVL